MTLNTMHSRLQTGFLAFGLILLATSGLMAQFAGGPGGGGPGGGGPGGGGPAGLPPVMVPPQNPMNPAKVLLGKALFWDEQLSSDNTMACGTCHIPSAAGTDPTLALNPGPDGTPGTPDDKMASAGVIRSDGSNDYLDDAVFGLNRQVTPRSAPTVINAAFIPNMFWDGRATSEFRDPVTNAIIIPMGGALESQAVGPILSSTEMAHDGRNWPEVVQKLATVTPLKLATNLPTDLAVGLGGGIDYPTLFANAFGTAGISAARIGMAIASYERTLIADQTPFDAFAAGNFAALTPNQLNGFMAFNTSGRCNVCHTPPFFSNQTFRNVGLRPLAEDEGRFDVTGNPADRGRFKVPTLRNVGLKSSFMHNGQFQNLNAVLNFYANNGNFNQNKDPVIDAILLTPGQRAAIVDFLQNALTDSRVVAELPPFDRPTLASEHGMKGIALRGTGISGSGGATAELIATSPANIGNVDFKVGLHGVLGGTIASLLVSNNNGFGGLVTEGLPVWVDITDPSLQIYSLTTAGVGPGAGFATGRFVIPNLPGLIGASVHAQWFAADSMSTSTHGYVSSEGTVITLF